MKTFLMMVWLMVGTLAAEQYLLVRPTVRETLGEHMAAQLSSRTNGSGFDFIGIKTNNSWLVAVPPVMTNNFYLRDVTNILATGHVYWDVSRQHWSIGACLSAISPRHCVQTTHVGGFTTNIWLLPDGTAYTNWMVGYTNLGGDLNIVLMARTNPMFYRVMPDFSTKAKISAFSKPALGVLMHHASLGKPYVTTFVTTMLYPGQFGQRYNQFEFGDYSLGYVQVVGDSSSPMLAVIHDEAILIAQTYLGSMYGPAPGLRVAQVNAGMNWLSTNYGAPVYTVQVADLSGFPDL